MVLKSVLMSELMSNEFMSIQTSYYVHNLRYRNKIKSSPSKHHQSIEHICLDTVAAIPQLERQIPCSKRFNVLNINVRENINFAKSLSV